MEQLPNDVHTERRLLADIAHYCGQVHEAHGSYPGTMLAVANFLVRQLNFTYEDATSFVKTSDFFGEHDASHAIDEKSALALLLLTDDLIEMEAMVRIGFQDSDQADSLHRWYSNLASTALGMAGRGEHGIEDCCADSAVDSPRHDDVACMTSGNCVFRTTRQFLLEPALQPNLAAIFDNVDALLQHTIVRAKLSAAVDCEFITTAQKEVLDAIYRDRVAAGGSNND